MPVLDDHAMTVSAFSTSTGSAHTSADPVDPTGAVAVDLRSTDAPGTRPDRGDTGGGRADSVTPTAVVAEQLSVRTAEGTTLLAGIDLRADPGELVAIVGASGAGKSTLLDALAGNIAPSAGSVSIAGEAPHLLTVDERRRVAYVPQADIVPEDLPLARMLSYAARLRLSAGATAAERRAAVATALEQVALTDVAHLPVKRLSGGQRKRASVAVELLTSPDVCFLDEPTSGLDPETSALVVDELRMLADRGRTVIFVTHSANDLRRCDRVIALGTGGRLLFDGSPRRAAELAGSVDPEVVHRALVAGRITERRPPAPPHPLSASGWVSPHRPPWRPGTASSRFTQWLALTARTLETVVRNRLTLAVMVGSPAMVIAMFAVLFQPGAFAPDAPSPTSAVMIAFWVAFGGFFFGLTYGLLQICPEVDVITREHRSGVSAWLQVAAKLAALTPVLLAIDVAMLAVLRGLDRLPPADLETYGSIAVTLALDALAALALGLLASSLVRNPAQAALALPMLCFPAVLFSGAVLPVPVMATVGQGISAIMTDRWAFEAIGRDLGLRGLFAGDPSPFGPALLDEYGDTWTVAHGQVWLILGAATLALSLLTAFALSARCRHHDRGTTASS